jgi:hypothetical protein
MTFYIFYNSRINSRKLRLCTNCNFLCLAKSHGVIFTFLVNIYIYMNNKLNNFLSIQPFLLFTALAVAHPNWHAGPHESLKVT